MSVERVIASQLNYHVICNGLENINQPISMVTQLKPKLLSIKSEGHPALARGEATAVVLLDQYAAFETIDYATLINCQSS